MALLFIDGFDHYASADLAASPVIAPWDTVVPQNNAYVQLTTTTRFSTGNALWVGPGGAIGVRKNLSSNISTVILGFACGLWTGPAAGTALCSVWDANTVQCDLRLSSTYGLYATRNGTQIGTTSTNVMQTTTWYFVEVKFTVHPTAGAIEVHVDGNQWLNLTGLNTQNTANAYLNQIALGTLSSSISGGVELYDDFYACDTSGSINNDFLGDVRVLPLYPNGVGANTNFTIGGTTPAATNWQSTNETRQDADVTYVYSATPGQVDTYAYSDLPSNTSSIKGISASYVMKRDSSGTRTVSPIAVTGVSTQADANTYTPVAGAYKSAKMIMENNPNTASPWTISDVNSSEFGLKVVT